MVMPSMTADVLTPSSGDALLLSHPPQGTPSCSHTLLRGRPLLTLHRVELALCVRGESHERLEEARDAYSLDKHQPREPTTL